MLLLKTNWHQRLSIKIWINDEIAFQRRRKRRAFFQEIAYGLYQFQDMFKVDLKPGANKILIKRPSMNDECFFPLRPINKQDTKVKNLLFSLELFAPEVKMTKWLCTEPFRYIIG